MVDKTYEFIDILSNSSLIKELTKYKNLLLKDKDILNMIKEYNNSSNELEKQDIKIKLYSNYNYKKYMEYYNELSFIVLKINNKYREYTNTKE